MDETLLEFLEANGFIHFGSAIPGSLIREFLGLEIPAIATKAIYDRLALKELSEIDRVREALLRRGMYLKAAGPDYRILLPSENAVQIQNYEDSATRKLKRADMLAKTTPHEPREVDQQIARLQMKQEAAATSRRFGQVAGF